MIVINENEDRTFAWLSYITIFGWIIAFFLYLNNGRNNSLVRFHLRQSLGITLTGMVASFISPVIKWFPLSGFVLGLIGIAILILWLIGLMSAISGEKKPVPFIGTWYEKILSFVE
jgi:uncharacterized membrane protein